MKDIASSSAGSSSSGGAVETLAVGKNIQLVLESQSLAVVYLSSKKAVRSCCASPFHPTSRCEIPYFDILWAELSHDYISIKHAVPQRDVSVATLYWPVPAVLHATANDWVEQLLSRAYGSVQRRKRIKVLVNPYGGQGRGSRIYTREVEPVLAAAQCDVDVELTNYRGHGVELAEQLDIDRFDVVACASGDGTVHEVFNGLGRRPDAARALRKIAVTNIPCGSGNAMSWNLNGTGSPSTAALCIVKGRRTAIDLVSITQRGRRSLSFLSQSFGIIADSDLGTENLRWMGPARFTAGYLLRLLGKTTYPCDVSLKLEVADKEEIKAHYRARAEGRDHPDELSASSPADLGLPPLRYGTVAEPLPSDWTHVSHDALVNFYAGNMPLMAPAANFFPAALPADGCLDMLTVRGDIPRRRALGMMFALGEGAELFELPEVEMTKVSAYRMTPWQWEGADGFISIDGERVPFEPFQAEVHAGLGTVLSKSGIRYEAAPPR